VRLGGVDAIDAQGALAEALSCVEENASIAFDPSIPLDFSSSTPWLDIAAIRQSRVHIRLFSN
jgi:urease accessory protein UreF